MGRHAGSHDCHVSGQQGYVQTLDMLSRAGSFARHRAIGLVTDPATQVEIVRLLQRTLAEHHTLDIARDYGK